MNTKQNAPWTPPKLDIDSIQTGDMPGDKIAINESHVHKTNTIFPQILLTLNALGNRRFVISVYGGSGVGKSEIGSVLGHYLGLQNYPAYILSGDNYPHRIPQHNDMERLMTYRNAGLSALARNKDFHNEWSNKLRQKWPAMEDFQPETFSEEDGSWINEYCAAGRTALENYLGTEQEINFPLLNHIISTFKDGADTLTLKRMGRTPEDIRLEAVDFTGIQVLIIEWTHGNNPRLEDVDFPIFLFSTPAETLTHRLARSRDKNTDSPFISLVLEIEQEKLVRQAQNAKLILSKDGEVLSFSDFSKKRAESV
jgi:alpha-galactosidase